MQRNGLHLAGVVLILSAVAASASAQLGPDNVLVIVNTNSADSVAIGQAYVTKYGTSVRTWTYAGSTDRTITRATFNSEVRDPLRAYLVTDEGDGMALYKKVRALVTTKGVPRRIDDFDYPGLGDNAGAARTECLAQRYDAASVDAELALLHQDITPGAAPETSNYANNHIENPYHPHYAVPSRFHTYARDDALVAKTFVYDYILNGWRIPTNGAAGKKLAPGDMYLVTRLTGYTKEDVIAALGRCGVITINKNLVTVVIDRQSPPNAIYDGENPYGQGSDFPETRDLLAAAGFNVRYDDSSAFVTTAPHSVVGYASYGVNGAGCPGRFYVLNNLAFNLAPGAIFNTYESWNGRDCEAVDPYDPAQHDPSQGQVADWLRIGGTLGLAHVWEPFAFSVCDNEVLYKHLLVDGWTFAEAAYASMPVLSWQHIVVGDPLTRFNVIAPPLGVISAWQISASHGGAGEVATTVSDGYVEPRLQAIRTITVAFSKSVDPATLTAAAVTLSGQLGGNLAGLISSLELDGTLTRLTIGLSQALADGDNYAVAITSTLKDIDGQSFTGDLQLQLSVLAGDVDASGVVSNSDITTARSFLGRSVAETDPRYDVDRSGAVSATDMLAIRARLGAALPR